MKHTQIVAVLHIASGVLSLIGALAVFLLFGVVGGIVVSQGAVEAAGILGFIAIALSIFLTVIALPSLIGGWALLAGKSWGRPVVLILGVLGLLNFPIGTALGVYTLWALLSEPAPPPTVYPRGY